MSAAADLRLRQKQPVGIAAGAEDAKYQAKYKELKRKVKDIEADNDKLHFKVLQAKLTIRRMKMERAILYERLTTIPPSPSLQDRHPLPPMSVMQGGGPGPPHPALTHLRPPGGGQPQHRDYPFHPSSNVDIDQQRVGGGGPAPHIHAGHPHHEQHRSHSRGDPRMNLTPGIDPRTVPVDNQPAASPPRLPVHSPPSRISSTHEGNIPRQSQHTIPPTSAPYEPRGASNIPHDNHHVHTPPASSHHNAQVGGSHSRKRSHSHSSPRTTHPHQIEAHPSAGHIHTAQPYRVLSSGTNSNNPGRGPGSGTVTPAGPLGQQALHQYPENLAPLQPPLNSPPLSEVEFERGGRSHHPHPHLHQQLPHQHAHSHTGGGHQHPHSQHPHHHHVVHHHHQHNHPHSTQAQAHAQNEYGGGLPVGDPPTSSTAIQAHGAGYEGAGGRGTVSSGPSVAASASGAPPAGSASGSSRTHAHPRERGAYDYPPTTQPEGRRERDRERDGGRERERERDADREWERERDRAREYSRGELINYSPPHHRTRSSQSRPVSRTHSQSHPASGGRSQSQTAANVGHNPNPNPSGEYEQSASNSSRGLTAPSSAVPAPLPAHTPQAQYHSSPEDQPQGQAYRDYPPDSNTMYAPRLAPSSRAASPGVPSNAGSGSAVGHTTVAGPDTSINSGPRDRDRDREGQRDRGRQQTVGLPSVPSPAAAAGGSGDNDASDHNNQAQDSGRKRSRNEMEMEADEDYQANNDAEEGGEGRPNGVSASSSGREVSLQPQDDSRGAKRYHREADSSPERERR